MFVLVVRSVILKVLFLSNKRGVPHFKRRRESERGLVRVRDMIEEGVFSSLVGSILISIAVDKWVTLQRREVKKRKRKRREIRIIFCELSGEGEEEKEKEKQTNRKQNC